MTQQLYIRSSTATSKDIRHGVIKNMSTGACVLEGGDIVGGGVTSNLGISIHPYTAITDTGYIIKDDDTNTLELTSSSTLNYTIVLELLENDIIGTNKAYFKFVEGLHKTYENSIVFGWLLYTGTGSNPTDDMIWLSPRGLNTGNTNAGWRDIKFPLSTANPITNNSRSAGNGIYQYATDTFTPTPPENFFTQEGANFTSTLSEPYDISVYDSNIITFEINGIAQNFVINVASYTGAGVNATAAELCLNLMGQLTDITATVVDVSGNNGVNITTQLQGEDATLRITSVTGINSISLLNTLGWSTTTYTPMYEGSDILEPMYETYTIPAGETINYWNTTQFNLKEVPSMYEWRFTIPTTNFSLKYIKVAINGTNYPAEYIQTITEVTGSYTTSVKLRFLNKSILEQALGGIITIHIVTELTATFTDVLLTHYYYALNQWAYPMANGTYYTAASIDPINNIKNSQYVEDLTIAAGSTVTLDAFNAHTANGCIWDFTLTEGSTKADQGTVNATWEMLTPIYNSATTINTSIGGGITATLIAEIVSDDIVLKITNASASTISFRAIRRIIKN